MNLKIPPQPARAKFQIDAIAVVNAQRELGIEKGIWFRWTTAKNHGGTHSYDVFQGTLFHRILVEQNSPIKHANFIMWHELQHAVQLEMYLKEGRKAREFSEHYNRFQEIYGYDKNPFEVDANRVASEHRDKWLLIAK